MVRCVMPFSIVDVPIVTGEPEPVVDNFGRVTYVGLEPDVKYQMWVGQEWTHTLDHATWHKSMLEAVESFQKRMAEHNTYPNDKKTVDCGGPGYETHTVNFASIIPHLTQHVNARILSATLSKKRHLTAPPQQQQQQNTPPAAKKRIIVDLVPTPQQLQLQQPTPQSRAIALARAFGDQASGGLTGIISNALAQNFTHTAAELVSLRDFYITTTFTNQEFRARIAALEVENTSLRKSISDIKELYE
jgi:hypothetical protein